MGLTTERADRPALSDKQAATKLRELASKGLLEPETTEPIEEAVNAWRAAITGGGDVPAALPAKVRELVWASGWEERANDHLPHLLGLPGGMPFLRFDRAVGRTNAGLIALALMLVAISYGSLTLYDLLALRTLGRKEIPYRIAALASFTSYPIAHGVGAWCGRIV